MFKTIFSQYFSSLWSPLKTKKTFLVYSLLLINTQLFAAEGYSEINNFLFDNPHMQNIKVPGTLNYVYLKTDTNDASFKDLVSVDITNITPNSQTDQAYNFFSGKNKQHYQPRTKQSGNGVFMLFLEWDIHQLERQTGGSWRHFQRRIRWAMATGAEKKAVQINYQGRQVQGIQFTIQPYANDEKIDRLGPYANKYYSFTLSDEIPGTIYEVRSFTPKNKVWNEGDDLINEERITFTSFKPSAER